MTSADLDRIEKELAIQLPIEYRETMTAFPIRFDRANADSQLWDNAEALIRQNQELRTTKKVGRWFRYNHIGWPAHLFFIGGDCEVAYVLDLRQTPCRVLTIGDWDISGYEQPNERAPTFNKWLESYLDDLRKDGIDLNSPTDPVRPIPKSCLVAIAGFFLSFLAALISAYLFHPLPRSAALAFAGIFLFNLGVGFVSLVQFLRDH